MIRAGLFLVMGLAAATAGAASLAPCPSSPNCVSTLATDSHAIAPIRYASTHQEAMRRLLTVLRAIPRTTIIPSGDDSVRAEFRTRVFRFTDDAHFVFDEQAKTIHFRSASRVGHSDLGVNRRRMEGIHKAFDKLQASK